VHARVRVDGGWGGLIRELADRLEVGEPAAAAVTSRF
jgi:hypothetical protein